MNMKTLVVLVLMGLSLSATADHPDDDFFQNPDGYVPVDNSLAGRGGTSRFDGNQNPTYQSNAASERTLPPPAQTQTPESASGTQADANTNQNPNDPSSFVKLANPTGNKYITCTNNIGLYEKAVADSKKVPAPTPATVIPQRPVECYDLQKLAVAVSGNFEAVDPKESVKESMDKTIKCTRPASYTVDFDSCEKALAHYNSVVNGEAALNVAQQIQTDLKNKKIQAEATQRAQQGAVQDGMFDAAIESNKHQKGMQEQKMYAYGMAVAALTRAYMIIPGKSQAVKSCQGCEQAEKTVQNNERTILANQNAKSAIGVAVATYTAKAIAAGLSMKQFKTKADKIAEAKKPFAEEGDDIMMERCAFNPTDPACSKPGNRVAGQSFSGGDFGVDGSGNNAFNMNPEGDNLVEVGAETDLAGNDGVAGINSPFADEAKNAQKILDPAAAAQMQASGGAAGGGSGGGAGGGGGGGASLGSDLAGADKDGDKEASIKTNKVSGVYGAAGGGGYKGIGKGKEDANPFSSLFDAKSGGGIEEDRSIASGDIDGAASGLFQKISKRYGQIQADKRVETKNLE